MQGDGERAGAERKKGEEGTETERQTQGWRQGTERNACRGAQEGVCGEAEKQQKAAAQAVQGGSIQLGRRDPWLCTEGRNDGGVVLRGRQRDRAAAPRVQQKALTSVL